MTVPTSANAFPRAWLLTALVLAASACTPPEPPPAVPAEATGGGTGASAPEQQKPAAGEGTAASSGAATTPQSHPADSGVGAPPSGNDAAPGAAAAADAAPAPLAELNAASTAETNRSPDAWFYKSKPSASLGKPGRTGTTIYTNEDLSKFSVPPGEDAPTGDGSLDADLVALQQRAAETKEKNTARQEALAGLRRQLGELEADKARMERREASLKNPLLPRVEATPEEAEEEKSVGAAARLSMMEARRRKVEEQIAQVKAQIESFSKP